MKVVFVSNYYNHHQAALSEAFYKLTGGNYFFIQTMPMETERKAMGWGKEELPVFVKESYVDEKAYQDCIALINDADAVIIGSAPNHFIKDRLKQRKLVFRYSERIYKNWKNVLTLPLRFIKYHTYNYGSKNVYLLCASAYAAKDYAKTFNYIGKSFKWGYFPEVKKYDDIEEIFKLKRPVSILWTARFIKWKHPEVPVKIAEMLKKEGYDFELNMIGDGVCREEIEKLIKKKNLEDRVHLLGAMSPEEVRENMERSEIFLFTSDRNEGWGAVLNESMNSACAVVACKSIGSVPYLIKDGENGFIYKHRDIKALYKKIKFLIDNPEERKEIGRQAYKTMTETWNAEVAVKNFLTVFEMMMKKTYNYYNNEPCERESRGSNV